MTGEGPDAAPFEAHVGLLQAFIADRDAVVARIEGLLNAKRRPVEYLQDRALLSRQLEDCFFLPGTAPGTASAAQAPLRGRLLDLHWTAGFRPHRVPGLHNDIVDPGELMLRGFHCWRLTRWPGRNGRERFAQTLFNLYLLRQLSLLAMRTLDVPASGAGSRLAQVESLLDALWKSAPADQPVLVRDARWLIPLAQSPTTLDLGAYLDVAQRVAENLPIEDGIEISKAHVRIAGGHLCSQTRHYCLKDDLSIDDHSVLMRSRTSNALDYCILIQGLVPLLEVYERAVSEGKRDLRIGMAGAICQGISADPELFVNRLELLGPYSMIETVFVAAGEDGKVGYTPLGQRHLRLLADYSARIGRMAAPLLDDCDPLRPIDGRCSPYGVIFGTATNLIEDMALKTLDLDAETRFSLEDVFVDADPGGDKLAWVNGWRRLPHVAPEVQRLYAYPQPFAAAIFDRVERELRKRVADSDPLPGHGTGRIYIESASDPEAATPASSAPDLPAQYLRSDDSALLDDRQEGHFAVSYRSPQGWAAVSKGFLMEVLGAGRDARIAGLPPQAAETLRLMCPGLVATPARRRSAAQ